MRPELADSASTATAEQVTRDTNLIARNFECRGRAIAASETANHIRRFWAPRLRSTLIREARAHPDCFSPIATDAVGLLDERDAPATAARALPERLPPTVWE